MEFIHNNLYVYGWIITILLIMLQAMVCSPYSHTDCLRVWVLSYPPPHHATSNGLLTILTHWLSESLDAQLPSSSSCYKQWSAHHTHTLTVWEFGCSATFLLIMLQAMVCSPYSHTVCLRVWVLSYPPPHHATSNDPLTYTLAAWESGCSATLLLIMLLVTMHSHTHWVPESQSAQLPSSSSCY